MQRIDRGGAYTIPLWIGLFLTGVYVLVVPRVDPLISERLEDVLAVAFMVGAGLCLLGVALANRVWAYMLEIVGLAVTFAVLGFLAMHVDRSLVQQFTMAGSLGAIIQIGSVRMMIMLGRELKGLL